jgi:hypothetical protein
MSTAATPTAAAAAANVDHVLDFVGFAPSGEAAVVRAEPETDDLEAVVDNAASSSSVTRAAASRFSRSAFKPSVLSPRR